MTRDLFPMLLRIDPVGRSKEQRAVLRRACKGQVAMTMVVRRRQAFRGNFSPRSGAIRDRPAHEARRVAFDHLPKRGV